MGGFANEGSPGKSAVSQAVVSISYG